MIKDIPEDLLEGLLNNPYESLILIDAEGIVRYMSPSNEGVYPIRTQDAIGKHIREVSPKTRLPRVLKTGKAEIGRSMVLQSKNRVIARIPIIQDGKIIGAAGKLMFMSPKKLKELYDRIENLETKINFYKDELDQVYGGRYSFESIIGDSPPMKKAKDLAKQAAETDASVIITGESGTGKELFAHSIHQASLRAGQNFVRVNCAAIPSELIESELFGYEAGAFTGARKQGKPGKFELAHNGTILLDEIGDMPMALQVKLLRVLEEKEIERIGSGKPTPVNFRLISATNRNLKKLIDKKSFRLDLYYRLNVVHIHLPALREIRDDLDSLINHIIRKLSIGGRSKINEVSHEAMEAMKAYNWPGNIRELRNVIERAMIVSNSSIIEQKDLPIDRAASVEVETSNSEDLPNLKHIMEETERRVIMKALLQTNNNKVKAAEILGIHRTGLYQKMKKHDIE